MSSRISCVLVAVAVVACQGDGDGDRPAAPPAPPTAVASGADAGVPADAGVTTLPSFDPAAGYHLDDGPAPRPSGRLPPRERKVAQILLRSTPSGAVAGVDGVRVGPTPVLWEGLLDGQAREFTFVMAGHAGARYRFVPVTSGIVHGTLVKITDDKDAGTPEIPMVQPPAPPAAPAPTIDAATAPGLGPTP